MVLLLFVLFFCATSPNALSVLTELEFKPDVTHKHPAVQKLDSLLNLSFHSFGGGSERESTVREMYSKQISVGGKSISYTLVHDKEYGVKTHPKHPAHHQLPSSLRSFFFLHRLTVSRLNSAQNKCFVFLQCNPNDRVYDVNHAAAEIFDVDIKSIRMGATRQMACTVSNRVLTRSANLAFEASEMGAEMCSHTPRIHNLFYQSYLSDRFQIAFELVHRYFGEPSPDPQGSGSVVVGPIASSVQLRALRLWTGDDNASFRSEHQSKMVDFSCNLDGRHSICALPPGSGKTLIVTVPVVARFLSCIPIGLQILVQPYKFLQRTHFDGINEKMKSRFGDQIRVCSLSQSEVNSSVVQSLRETPPHILVITIDAAFKLVSDHFDLLQSWVDSNVLKSVAFDEIQTMILEKHFRPVYDCVAEFPRLAVPISLLSGSFPEELFEPLCRKLGLLTDSQLMDTIDVTAVADLIGSNFSFKVVDAGRSNKVNNLAKLVQQSLVNGSVHVICQTAKDANDLGAELSRLGVDGVRVVTSKDVSATHFEVAHQWRKKEIRVLIATTLGLVGNENFDCKTVIVYKHLFCLSYLIQAIGRFRLEQRGPRTVFYQVLTSQCQNASDPWSQSLVQQCDLLVNEFIGYGALCVEAEAINAVLSKWFHINGCIRLFQMDGCVVKNLANFLSDSSKGDCGRCSWCEKGQKSISVLDLFEGFQDSENGLVNPDATSAPQSPPRPNRGAVLTQSPNSGSSTSTSPRHSGVAARNPNSKFSRPRVPTGHTPQRNIRRATSERVTANQSASASQAQSTFPPAAIAAASAQRVSVVNSRLALVSSSLMQTLNHRCVVCGSAACQGKTCIGRRCLECGEMGHGLVNCPWARPRNGKWDGREQGKRLRDFIISRSHCPFCLGKKECRSIGSHKNANGADACSLGSRLRRLVMRVREIQGPQRQSHGDFLRTILHSENEFNLFCQKQVIAIGANNGTRGRA